MLIFSYLQDIVNPYNYFRSSPDQINNQNDDISTSNPVFLSTSTSTSTSTTTTSTTSTSRTRRSRCNSLSNDQLLISFSLQSNSSSRKTPSLPQPISNVKNKKISHKSLASLVPSSLRTALPQTSNSFLSNSYSSRSSSQSSSYAPLSPRATQDLISRLDATSSLLPQNLANFITAASIAARVSLRSSAFCIELVIESLRYSTSTSLGITRRALISAVGGARATHHEDSHSIYNARSTHSHDPGYLTVLDHYTNVGIYLVHHVFTMAELLALAGLDLTHSVISTGFETAQLSVMLLDSIFGSNESSRALSAIIMLVRRELLHDPDFTPSHSSTLAGIISLTKATIAFACLQLATSRRTSSTMKMRVVLDATIITQSEIESKSLTLAKHHQLGSRESRAHANQPSTSPALSHCSNSISPALSPAASNRSPRQSSSPQHQPVDHSHLNTEPRPNIPASPSLSKHSRITSFNSSIILTPSHSLSEAHCSHEREDIEFELNQFLTQGENQTESDECEPNLDLPNRSLVDRQLPDPLKQALYHLRHPPLSRVSSKHALDAITTPVLNDSSTPGYLLTALTTTTTTSRVTTSTFAHSNGAPEKFNCDQFENSLIDGHRSTHPKLSPERPLWPTKSAPSSPHPSHSTFPSTLTVMAHSLTRSRTYSDLSSVRLHPCSLVCPLPNFFPPETPLSSPSITSDASSQQSIMEHEVDAVAILDLSEDDEERQPDCFYYQDHPSPRSSQLVPPRSHRPELSSPQSSLDTPLQMNTSQATKATYPRSQSPMSDFPPQSLITNLGRFMRYSSAAYGQQFMRIMGIGVDSFNYPNTKKHSANDHAFASHVRLPVDQILLGSFAEPNPQLGNETLSPLVHYVTIDHDVRSVVLTCRGTLGLSDVLVDLTCEYEPIEVDGGDQHASYLAHSGMLHSARRLRQESSTVHEVIKQTLFDYPSYGLIITGHSLGGGVAALLAVLCSTRSETFLEENHHNRIPIDHPPIITQFVTSFRSGFPPGRPIHSYTYGTPAVASLDLSEYTKGLVTTVCNGIDLVPTLSLGVLHDLKSVAVSLHQEENIAMEIITKVVGLYRPNPQQPPQQQHKIHIKSPNHSQVPVISEAAGELFGRQEEHQNSKENVRLRNHEIQNGVGDNRANFADYLDPALDGSHFGKAESHPELGDWLWSLRRTMKAVSDAEKLYPPGDVWHVESHEVFVVKEDGEEEEYKSSETQWKNKSNDNVYGSTFSRREGRRIILRACDDVQARFSEPIFGKTMFHDHIPSQYELVLELLLAAVTPDHNQRTR